MQCKIDLSDEELDDLELPVVCGEVERGAAVHRRVHVEARRRGQLADAVCKVAKLGDKAIYSCNFSCSACCHFHLTHRDLRS